MTAITKLIGLACTLILLAYVAWFAVVNSAIIAVQLWPEQPALNAPLWLIVLCAFSGGLLVTACLASLRISALRLRLYRISKRASAQMAKDTPPEAGDTDTLFLDEKR